MDTRETYHSRPGTHYHIGPVRCGIVNRPWFIDLLTFLIVAMWMAGTYEIIHTYGPGPYILTAAVIVLLIGLLMIYGQRLEYIEVGDNVHVSMRNRHEDD